MTKKYLCLNLSDQEDPMEAQDRFVASVVQDSALSGYFYFSQYEMVGPKKS
jgi:hypothetical protein